VCTKQRRIAEIARQHPQERLRALHHYLDIEWMSEALYHARRDSAPGVDGQTVDDYEEQLEEKPRLPDHPAGQAAAAMAPAGLELIQALAWARFST